MANKIIIEGQYYAAVMFNSMVSDYNARCGNFRYLAGRLEEIRSELEGRRLELESEGMRQVQTASSYNLTPPASPSN